MIQSPLNYTGGKYRLLSQILPLFPKNIDLFVDLFCGGCNVGVNAASRRVVYNDLNRELLRLYDTFRRRDKETVLGWIYQIIEEYHLSQAGRFGYDHYGCESGKGLGEYNREGYLRLRADYNRARQGPGDEDYTTVMLYVLIVYAFNNQIRFNRQGEFNLPVGKRDFNPNMERKLSDFIDRLKEQDCRFTCRDFRDFDVSSLGAGDFVYADPPYLIACAPYNEQGGWNEELERALLDFLDRLDGQGVRFALSNVLRSKGKENKILLEWLDKHRGKYRAIHLNYSYANASYHTKDRLSVSEEVLIVNYREEGAMSSSFPYKSFCWSLGTTSFRTKGFNRAIEWQLMLLDEFWQREENRSEYWSGNNAVRTRYYDFIKEKGFLEGDANNKPKDAREKTSGLVDIGLIDSERRLSPAGRALMEAVDSRDFRPDNFLQIPKDSFLYLKQLLKTSCAVEGKTVRPFIVMLYVLSRAETLSYEEFTYLLPLCTSPENTEQILRSMWEIRAGKGSVDEVILSRLMGMDNYQAALEYFLDNGVSDEVICAVGMNRKSRGSYDPAYTRLYHCLYSVYVEHNLGALPQVYEATRAVKIGIWWRRYLFDTTSQNAIKQAPVRHQKRTAFDGVSTEAEFKRVFFRVMHLFKAKANLSDYFDLNRRYIRTTNTVLFEDGTVKLDIIPKHFFSSAVEELYARAYTRSDVLFEDCPLEEISAGLVFRETAVIDSVNAELGTSAATLEEARTALEDERYRRLQHLIDTRFTDQNLLRLLDCFEKRNDITIRSMVTDSADVPTIFEYVLGIIWYKVSRRRGRVLDYMKLSLDADLLPKTHAAGGGADIVYEYAREEGLPEHALLLEATLADKNNQRRMEMEPVSRHLGDYILKSGNTDAYCVFVTNYLHINVTSDFRGRKHMTYYDVGDNSRRVDGMKIIPLQTSELKRIISDGRTYEELYPLFEEAYQSDLPPHQWYEGCISAKL